VSDAKTVLEKLATFEMAHIPNHMELYGYAVDLRITGDNEGLEFTLSELPDYGPPLSESPLIVAVWHKSQGMFLDWQEVAEGLKSNFPAE
jgi:hypothetical protein